MPPQEPDYRIQARRRMRQALLPEPTAAHDRMLREAAQSFQDGNLAPLAGERQITAPPSPRALRSGPQEPGLPAANEIPMRRGVTMNLGLGTNHQQGNERAGQEYRAFINGGREIHRYADGTSVQFARKASPELTSRAQSGIKEVEQANLNDEHMAALAKAAMEAKQQTQQRRRRAPIGAALLRDTPLLTR